MLRNIVAFLILSVGCVNIYSNTYGADVDNVQLKLNKNGFYYEQVITIKLKDYNSSLVQKNGQLYNPNNYTIYPETEQGNPKNYIHPYKVKRGETTPTIFLFVELQPKVAYALEVASNTVAYENGKYIDFGTITGITINEKYLKYLKYQAVSKLDMNTNLSIDGDIKQNLINTEQNLLHLELSGRVYIDKSVMTDSPLNNVLGSLELNHSFESIDYVILSAHVSYETTQDFDTKNIVTGAALESLFPIPRWLTFSQTQFSPFPVIKLGYDFARSINFNDNMNRLTGSFIWKIPIGEKITFENLFNGIADVEHNSQQYGYREQAVYYKISDDTRLMIVKIAEGKQPPLFEYARTITTGISINFFDVFGQKQ